MSSRAEMREERKAKASAMTTLYRSGYTLQQIGEQYGITRERVRQLITLYNGSLRNEGGQAVQAAKARTKKREAREARCMKLYGCTLAQYRDLRRIGKAMTTNGKGYACTPLGAFNTQRCNAAVRDIGWELTFWQWWTIWQQSGKWGERGRGNGYVMSRHGDKGPYALGNVAIIPGPQNTSEGTRKRHDLPCGVVEHRPGRYSAKRMLGGVIHNLGIYSNPAEAHAAYLAAAPVFFESVRDQSVADRSNFATAGTAP